MSENPQTRLVESLEEARREGVEPDLEALALEYGLAIDEVRNVARGLAAMQEVVAEPVASEPLPAPDLPEDLELGDELGRGGMGIVYRAHQRSLDREVAVKVLRPGELVFGEALARFRREVRALAKLRHSHIVTIHEVGESGGHVYYVMDLFEQSLADLLAQKRRPMPVARVARLVEQVASAVAFVHAHGLVHRDLKPANVLLDEVGDAYVADFGLAVDPSEGATLTATGNLLGTPDYMAPEQALGDRARVSERTDVYALGTILYQCLTGRTPFAGRALVDKIHAVAHERPPAPRKLDPGVPRDLERVCFKAMAKDPDDRYATARAFAEDLQRFMDGRPVEAQAPSAWRRVRGAFRRQGRSLALAGAAAGAALAFGWWGLGWGNTGASKLASADLLWERGEYRAAGVLYEEAAQRLGGSVDDALAFHLTERRGRALLLDLDDPRRESGYERGERVEALRRGLAELASRAAYQERRVILLNLHRIAATEHLGGDPVRTETGPWPGARGLLGELVGQRGDPLHAAACAALLRQFQGPSEEEWRTGLSVSLDELALGALDAYPHVDESTRSRIRALFVIGLAVRHAVDPAAVEELSQALVTLVEDEGLDDDRRAMAATGLAALNDLPFYLAGVNNLEPIWDEDLAAENVRLWREGRGRAVAEQWRLGVEAALDALPNMEPVSRDATGGWRIQMVCRDWLVRRGAPDDGGADALRAWWRDVPADSRPRDWLLDALDLPGDPDLAALVSRLGRPDEARRVHTLLSCLVTPGTPTPSWPVAGFGDPPGLAAEWARVLGLHDEPVEVVLRVALARVPDGVGRAEWIEEWRVPLELAGRAEQRTLEFDLVDRRPRGAAQFFGTRFQLGQAVREGGLVEITVEPEYRDDGVRLRVRGDLSWHRRRARPSVAEASLPLERGRVQPLLDGVLTWSDRPRRVHRFLLMASFVPAHEETAGRPTDWTVAFHEEMRRRLEGIVVDPNRRRVTGDLDEVMLTALTALPNPALLPALDALHDEDPGRLGHSSSELEALLAARLACGGRAALPPRGKAAEWVEEHDVDEQVFLHLAAHPDHEVRRWVSERLRNRRGSSDQRAAFLEAWRGRDLPADLAWLREFTRPGRGREVLQVGVGLLLAALFAVASSRWPRKIELQECLVLFFAGACFATSGVSAGLQSLGLTLFTAVAWFRARRLDRTPWLAAFCLLSLGCWTALRVVDLPGLHAGAALFFLCAVASTPWLITRARPLVVLLAAVAVASRAAPALALATDALGVEDWSLLLRLQDHRTADLLDGVGSLAFLALLVVVSLGAPTRHPVRRRRVRAAVGA